MFKIAFIINGSKKLNKKVEGILIECENHPKLDVARFVTQKQKDATLIALDCAKNKFDYIIAVGGDGTMNEVLNGIMHFDGEYPVLGVLPIGTGNDFVKSAGFKLNHAHFIESLIEEKKIDLDSACIKIKDSQHFFLNIADVGFGAKVVEMLDRQRKYIGGKSSYALAILRTFLRYKKPVVSIRTDDFQYEGEILMVAICNGSTFGSGLIIGPNAKMDDGILNITLLKKVKLLDYVKNLKNLKSGVPIKHKEAVYLEAEQIDIKVIKGKAVTEIDGEFLNEGNISVSLHGKINVLNY